MTYRSCVNSGYCCTVRPCQFGDVTSQDNPSCKYLEPAQVEPGKQPRFVCGIYDQIKDKPGASLSPAFGAGCCSPLFNVARQAILKEEG